MCECAMQRVWLLLDCRVCAAKNVQHAVPTAANPPSTALLAAAAHRVRMGMRCRACRCPFCSQGTRCLCTCTGGGPGAAPSLLQDSKVFRTQCESV
jgi:hypothetical protein